MRVFTTRPRSNLENNSILRTLDRCENWLDLDLYIGVPPVENLPRSLQTWRGDLIFATDEARDINMTDVRDIVDFLSVCQEYPPMERGEMAARAQKLKIVMLSYHHKSESDPKAEPTFSQVEWPLDYPSLRRWGSKLRSCPPGRLTSDASSKFDIFPPIERVLEKLRLPLLAGKTDPCRAAGSDIARCNRVFLRKNYRDIDVQHVSVYVDFFTKHGRMMKGAFPHDNPATPPSGIHTLHPWLLRRLWQFHHYDYLKMRCVVKECESYHTCPLKPEKHDCWSVVGKKLFKRIFPERLQEVDSD
ncbi:hypothetical protein BKA64DRAFT_703372 [Cadophora sp. MPI-SDFR-AT-0126]|nr:hypothetical protein BKA64DRAFT_703372 [Leotiomycetes sp. MPI-SDFR-AT-0126]